MISSFLFVLVLPFHTFLLSMVLISILAGTGVTRELPAVILVPGAFHQAMVYEKVTEILHRSGYYDTTAIDLPSVGSVVDREPDIEAVRRVLTKKLQDGKDVLLVGNSYGGTVIGEAVKGLKNDQILPHAQLGRSNIISGAPRRGQILGLVFISGYLPYITEVTQPATKPDMKLVSPSFFRFTTDGKVYWDNNLASSPPERMFYNILDPRERPGWVKKLNYSSYKALAANATYIPYTGDFKCTYIIGMLDNSVPPAFAQTFIDQPGAKFEVEKLDADHVAMLSKPEDVARLIRKAAGI